MLTYETFPYSEAQMELICDRLSVAVTQWTPIGKYRLSVINLRYAFLRSGWSIGLHAHSFYEADIILLGEGNARGLVIGPGTLMVHEPHIPHSWHVPGKPCHCFSFAFHFEPSIILPPPDAWPVMPHCVDDILCLCHEAYTGSPGWEYRVNWRIGMIITQMLTIGEWPPQQAMHIQQTTDYMAMIELFLQDNLERRLTLNDVAAHMGMSRRTLTRLVRHNKGMSIMDRLLNLRMVRAAQLLLDSELPICEIAEQVGIGEPSYFNRCFRKYYRTTPQTYRILLRHAATPVE